MRQRLKHLMTCALVFLEASSVKSQDFYDITSLNNNLDLSLKNLTAWSCSSRAFLDGNR